MANPAFVCSSCGATSSALAGTCPWCHGIVETSYAEFNPRESDSPLVRYQDVIPITDTSILHRIQARMTPLTHWNPPFWSGTAILKDETQNVTGSTKDRMAAVMLPFLYEQGVREFTLSSTGNSAAATAWALRYFPEMTGHIFLGSEFVRPDHLEYADSTNNAILHVVQGTYAETKDEAAAFAKISGCYADPGFLNIGRREGLKLAYLEAFEQLEGFPTVIVQAVSSGMGILAARQAINAYSAKCTPKQVRIFCGQEESCAPMVTAAKSGSSVIRDVDRISEPHGLAKALLLGDPSLSFPWVKACVDATGGGFVSVGQSELLEAMAHISDSVGIALCEASSVAAAALGILCRGGQIQESDQVLILIGGRRHAGTTVRNADKRG